jgi:hypothetical protein
MKYNIIYSGEKVAVVDIPIKELASYRKVLENNLPKAVMERVQKAKLVVQTPPSE